MKASFLVREAWRSVTRHRTAFVLAAAVIALCITLLSAFLVVTVNVVGLLRVASQRGEVYAFVTDDAARDPSDLLARAAKLEGIRSVRFVSKEAAIEELRADLGTDDDLLGALSENPLPASIRLAVTADATTATEIDALERKLQLLPGVDEVWSGKELIAQLNRALRTVMILDILLLLVVSGSTIFIVFQTIENSISSRRREIEIMELIGATSTAVRIPFLLAGMTQGLLGGLSAFVVTVAIHRVLGVFTAAPQLPLAVTAAFDALLGIGLGLLGASIALSRGTSANPRAVRTPGGG